MTTLVRFTSFDFAVGIGYLPVWVNPAHVAYLQPRRRRDPHDDNADMVDGTLLYFQQEAGVLAVREETDYVTTAFETFEP